MEYKEIMENSYYHDNTGMLLKGDCFEVMRNFPDNFINMIVTSPPYNKQAVGGQLVKKIKYNGNLDTMSEDKYQKWQIEVLNECYRISDSLFYNHKIRYQNKIGIHPMKWILKTNWILHQEIIWNRKITGNIRGWRCWNIDERIYWLIKKHPPEISQELAQLTSVWEIRPEMKSNHPAPFPLEIAERCIKIGSKKGDIVLDPFIGSGTTAIACKNLKRRWIGIEKELEYCNMSVDRIKNNIKD